MEDEKLYRLRAKEGSNFNQKTNDEGWRSAIQFDEDNNLQGPLEYMEVDPSEYPKEIVCEYIENQLPEKTSTEIMIETAAEEFGSALGKAS